MYPFSILINFGDGNDGRAIKFVFVLFLFGVLLFCAGILLSIFGFQACYAESFGDCSVTLKVLGPSLAAFGLGCILIAKSRARLHLRQRQHQGEDVVSDSFFLCRESNQFAQFLTFGFLFLTSGVMISVLGMWVPGCSTALQHQQVNNNTSNFVNRNCGFLSLQIMGPLIVLVGLCFFVVAHIKKKHVPSPNEEVSEEEEQPNTLEPIRITVGDSVLVFPAPPPPYFADPLSAIHSSQNMRLPSTESPPSYNSIFNSGPLLNSTGRTEDGRPESIYTISTFSPTDILPCPYFLSDPPPQYEEKDESTDLPTPALPLASSSAQPS